MAEKKTDNRLGGNAADSIGGTLNLEDGLLYDNEGNVIERKGDPDKDVIQTDQIGAFTREVYADGSVASFQSKPLNTGGGEIVTPVPLPGETADVTGSGATDKGKQVASSTKK